MHKNRRFAGRNGHERTRDGLWASRLRTSFMPVIRERGERYAGERRVLLLDVSSDHIEGTVRGTVSYDIELFFADSGSGDIRTSCSCPFFRQGFPCKHLWAAIVEADRMLTDGDSDDPDGSAAMSGKTVSADRNWRRFFNRQALDLQDQRLEPDYSPGNFVPVYTLHVEEHELLFSAVEKYVKKDGSLGRKRKLNYSNMSMGKMPATDRLLMAVVDEISRDSAHGLSFYRSGMYEDLLLHPNDLEIILPLLADTGRCVVKFWKKGVVADPLSKGKPFEAGFMFSAQEDDVSSLPDSGAQSGLRLYPLFYLDHVHNTIDRKDIDCILNTRPLMFICKGKLHQVVDIPFKWVSQIYPLEYIEVARDDIPAMVAAAESIGPVPELELPEDIAPLSIESVKPCAVLVLDFEEIGAVASLFMDYDGLRIDWFDSRNSILDPDKWVRIQRRKALEQGIVTLLEAEGFRQDGDVFRREIKGITSALDSFENKGGYLEASNRKRIHANASTAFKVSSGMDWFDLEGVISYGDEIIPLPRAMHEFLKGNQTIRLEDGSMGLLPAEWLSKHMTMLDMALPAGKGEGKGRNLRFPAGRALMLDALLEENENVSLDRRFVEVRDAMQDFRGIERQQAPCLFRGVLRPYQEDTLGWFAFLEKMNFGGILADDMGLGKTVQVLAWLSRFVHSEKEISESSSPMKTCLVVVPTSLVFNWKSEAARFVPDMKVMVYGGPNRDRMVRNISGHHLVITTYGLMRRDIADLREIEFEYVILDESQAIKNPASQTAKAARLLRVRHRLCLTGTPLENNVGELWSQMEFLNPGILGSRSSFETRFLKPIDRNDAKALNALKTLVKPFILRRTKELVASDLPEKMEQTVFCVMPSAQADMYAKLRDHYRAAILSSVEQNGMNRSKIKVLEALLRLRQAANHPALVGYDDIRSGKLDELMQLIDEAVGGGHKALIFSQFTRMLALIRKTLDHRGISYEYLDGSVVQNMREARVGRFQDDDSVKLFLISLKAGGVGLNLTAADYVFIVDPWWNPAVELQAVDRTHRIGQDKRVFTYRFITSDTVEEKVLALQKQKQELVTSILSGSGDMLKNLSARDLDVLFS